ncbi:hypothetical protein [Pectobacterium wasabiae]|uniref:Uncharacterized protein n=1 Tax=Pectobacterium wasabiae TaxID=55208 RepID=A0AAW3EGA9_9GAMM|nr:hypothetical protein [Pectobacterium wasabiae]AOR63389.1 hypothetical protein A7983_08970 [Pectobacterium wasabiae CFBP 3304]EJS96066.1 Hypothetical protein Y17_0698 [Pectobacterium wasabiae CFBP 3304]KFX04112.1 hypothetical protein JV38_16470 [Pectobacterium wasabiae]KGA27246.1 hypothetical protein KU73_16460 [Pectobacterium wasabiae]
MKYYYDTDGYPALEIEHNFHVIADFLQSDVQSSLYGVNEYISVCDDVISGKIPKWEGTGNAHTVTINIAEVSIYNEYTEEEINISSIEGFKIYLEGWKKLLLRVNSK